MSSKNGIHGRQNEQKDRLRPVKHRKCGCGCNTIADGDRRNRRRMFLLKTWVVESIDPRNVKSTWKYFEMIENSRRKRERIKAAREYKMMQDAEVPESGITGPPGEQTQDAEVPEPGHNGPALRTKVKSGKRECSKPAH
jgi:hypothetical protein